MGGINPTTMSESNNTYILPWEEPILPPCQKGTALTYDHGRNQSCHHVIKAQHLHLTMGGATCHHVRKAPTLTYDHGSCKLPPCQKGSQTHHFPFEGTLI